MMSSDVVFNIEPISAAGREKLVSLDWACERERLSFADILHRLQQKQSLRIFQDAPGGALLVSSAAFADFALTFDCGSDD